MTRDAETATRSSESEAHFLMFSPDGRWLASGQINGTILIWDVNEALGTNRNKLELTSAQREKCWSDLARGAKAALAASNYLAADPAGTVAFLRDRLKRIEPVPQEQLQRLLSGLDAPQYAERESATNELEAFGERVRPRLHAAMLATHSAEVRQRLNRLLESSLSISSPRRWRQFRAVALLEQIGGAEARAILADLSKGDPDAQETQSAAEALQRISELLK